MANEKDRDVRFRINGEDNSGAAFQSATANAKAFGRTAEEQTAKLLASADAAASLYNRLDTELDGARAKALEARKAYDAFAQSLSGTSEPSKKQVREFTSLGNAAERADKQVDQLAKKLTNAEASFNKNLSAVDDLDALQRRIAAERELADVEAFRQKAAQNRQAFKEAEYINEVTEALRRQEAQAKTAAFRDTGRQAAENAADLDKYRVSADGAARSSSTLANDLRAILDPGAAARSTLDGLADEAARVSGVIGEADKPIRDYQDAINDLNRVQASIQSQGAAVVAYQDQAAAVERAEAAYRGAQAEVIRLGRAQGSAVSVNEELSASLKRAQGVLNTTNNELNEQQQRLSRLRAPLDAAKISVNNLADAERKLKTAAEQAAAAQNKLDKATSGQGSATGRFLGLRPYEVQNLAYQINDLITQIASGTSITQALAQQGGQILQLGNIAKMVVAYLPRIIAIGGALVVVAGAFKQISDRMDSIREFDARLTLDADGQQYSAEALAGVTHELDRYGVKLKEARAAVKEFVSEGVDPKQIEAFGRAAKDTADVMGIDLKDAAKQVAEGFTGGYDAIVKLDEATHAYSAAQLETIRLMFEEGRADEARALAFDIYAKKVADAADNARGPWSEAFRSMGNAWDSFLGFVGNLQPIADAANNLNALSNVARSTFDWLDRVFNKSKQASEANARLEYQKAQTEAKANPLIAGAQKLGRMVNPLTAFLPGGPDPKAAKDLLKKYPTEQAYLDSKGFGKKSGSDTDERAKAEGRLTREYELQASAINGLSAAEKVEIATARLARVEKEARAKAQAANLTNDQTGRVVAAARAKEQAQIDAESKRVDEAAAKRGATAGRKAEAQAKAEQARREAEERSREALIAKITNETASMAARADRADKTDLPARLNAIKEQYAKVFADIENLRAKSAGRPGATAQIDAMEREVEANQKLLENKEQLAYYEDKRSALEDRRATLSKDIADRTTAGIITGTEAYNENIHVQEELGTQIKQNAEDAIKFAEALALSNPTPALLAYLDAFKRSQRLESGTVPEAQSQNVEGRKNLNIIEGKVNELISQRSTLLQINKNLYDEGAISQAEYERRSQAAFTSTAPLIKSQIEDMKRLVDLMGPAGLGQVTFDVLRYELELLGEQTDYVNEDFLRIKETLEEAFASGVTDVFIQIGEAIGEAVETGKGFKDVWEAARDGFRSFAADFLKLIAKMIIQALVLRAIQAVAGGGGVFGKVAGFVLSGNGLPVPVKHGGHKPNQIGGIRRTNMPADLFARAPRYHSGTLSADEEAAIIKKNEEVLTEDNPRHAKNWFKGMGAGKPADIILKLLNVLDPADVLSKALGSGAGERTLVNAISNNASEIKKLLEVNS